jgi:hypothetical protein
MVGQTIIRPHWSRSYALKTKVARPLTMPPMQHQKRKNITRPPLSKQIIKRKLQKKSGGRSHPDTGIQHDSAVTKKSTNTHPTKWREGKTIKPSDHPQIFGIRTIFRSVN